MVVVIVAVFAVFVAEHMVLVVVSRVGRGCGGGGGGGGGWWLVLVVKVVVDIGGGCGGSNGGGPSGGLGMGLGAGEGARRNECTARSLAPVAQCPAHRSFILVSSLVHSDQRTPPLVLIDRGLIRPETLVHDEERFPHT